MQGSEAEGRDKEREKRKGEYGGEEEQCRRENRKERRRRIVSTTELTFYRILN